MLPWILERSSIVGSVVIAMQSQLSGERRLIIVQASPHQREVSLECGRAWRLLLNLPYEFTQAASVHQSLENIIHARLGLVYQQKVGRKLTLLKIRSESIEALDARKANAVIPNRCYLRHLVDHCVDQRIDAVSIEVAGEQQIV